MVCVAMFFGAFALAGFIPPLKPHQPAAEIAAHYQTHTTGIRIGGVIMLMSGMFYAAFVAVVSSQMQRIPGIHRAAVTTQSVAGAFACLTFLVPAMILEVVAFRPGRPVGDTQMLNDMFWIFLVMPWTPFLTQNYAFAYAILTDPQERPLFPRWLAYVNLWSPIIFAPSIMLPFFKTGPFSWAGIFVMWIPAFVFIGQFVANVSQLLKAINSEERALREVREPQLA
ncbi:MAG: hypothetical protein QOF76_3669 [Solirubrobacteraceae bacterium]|jgi:hypothetical protein|nr:hypothetical protein [Solirubrobacteraceae bacterium]